LAAPTPEPVRGPEGDRAEIERAIEAYYTALSTGDYHLAYHMLSRARQAEVGPEAGWTAQVTGTQYVNLSIGRVDFATTRATASLSYDLYSDASPSCSRLFLRRGIVTEGGKVKIGSIAVLSRHSCS
jgi:hypothetical protein